MLALELEKSAVKGFMGKLLREGLFDGFEARQVEIAAAVKISIDGTAEGSPWESVRPLAYEIIKQLTKPRYVKIIFAQKNPAEIHANAKALFLNILYENDSVTFTTACAQKEFAMDKSLDTAWDGFMRKFFATHGLPIFERE